MSGLRKSVKIEKIIGPRRYAFGRALSSTIAGRPVVDADGDLVTPAELERTAHAFAGKRQLKVVHKGRAAGEMVESIVTTPDKAEALGLPANGDIAWWVGVRVDDAETWALVESGVLKEFSIGGDGERSPIARPADAHVSRYAPADKTHELFNLDLEELSLVPEGAGESVAVLIRKGRSTMLKIPFRLAVLDGDPATKAKVEKALRADDEAAAAIAKGALDMGHLEQALRMDPELLRIVANMIDQAQQAGIKPSDPEPEPAGGGLPDAGAMGGDDEADDEADKGGMGPDYDKEQEMTQKALKTLAAEKAELEKRLAAVEERAEAERADRERERYVAKARAEYGRLPMAPELVAELLRHTDPGKVAKATGPVTIVLSKEEATALADGLARVEGVMKASEAFRARGSSRPGSQGSDSAVAERDRIAAEIQKASPGMSLARARHEAMMKTPGLDARLRKGA